MLRNFSITDANPLWFSKFKGYCSCLTGVAPGLSAVLIGSARLDLIGLSLAHTIRLTHFQLQWEFQHAFPV